MKWKGVYKKYTPEGRKSMALKSDWNRNGNSLPTFKEQVISLFYNVVQGLETVEGFPVPLVNWFTEVNNP